MKRKAQNALFLLEQFIGNTTIDEATRDVARKDRKELRKLIMKLNKGQKVSREEVYDVVERLTELAYQVGLSDSEALSK